MNGTASASIPDSESGSQAAWSRYLAPRQDVPYFSKDAFHHPIAFTWGLCCPDFHYRHAFIDATLARYGRLDFAANVAGTAHAPKLLHELSLREFEEDHAVIPVACFCR